MKGTVLVAPSVDDIFSPRDFMWDVLDEAHISPAAKLVAVRMAEVACDISGEAFDRLDHVLGWCSLFQDELEAALTELTDSGVLNGWRIFPSSDSPRMLVSCEFEMGDLAYYGDDTNPPADWLDSLSLHGEEWRYEEGVDDVPANDPDPRRHRILSKTGYRCFYCIEAWAEHLDHMHPSSRGGGNEDDNMIGACRRCNIQKKDRTVSEFRAWLSHRHKLPRDTTVRFFGEANT